MSNVMILPRPPKVLGSASRDNPVGEKATLSYSSGSPVLSSTKRLELWSAHPTGLSVSTLNITKHGNLQVSSVYRGIVWQSFDRPTDTLVDGKVLRERKVLISSSSL